MGLDNGFILHTKNGEEVELAYFRKYYELDEWGRQHFDAIDTGKTLFYVTYEHLVCLEKELASTILILSKLSPAKIHYYDDTEYPEKYVSEMYGQTFDPATSQSAFAGNKAMTLYHTVVLLEDILEMNKDKEIKITFYSSY